WLARRMLRLRGHSARVCTADSFIHSAATRRCRGKRWPEARRGPPALRRGARDIRNALHCAHAGRRDPFHDRHAPAAFVAGARRTLPLALFGPQRYPVLMGQLALPILLSMSLSPLVGAFVFKMAGADGTLGLLALIAVVNVLLVSLLWNLNRRRNAAP